MTRNKPCKLDVDIVISFVFVHLLAVCLTILCAILCVIIVLSVDVVIDTGDDDL